MMKYSANISILWNDIPLRERLSRMSGAGLEAFEFLFVALFGLPELVAAREEFGLEVALFDLDIGDPTFKTGNGYLCLPEGEDSFFRSLDEALEAATRLECRRLNALAGRRTPGLSWERHRDLVVSRLERAAIRAAEEDVVLLVEPISTHHLPDYLLNYSWQAVEIVELVNHPNVRYQADIYHMQLMEGNLISTLLRHLPRIGHLQVADVPGRHEPGTGEINCANVLRALDAAGYQGFVGLEYSPLDLNPFEWIARFERESAPLSATP